ncbi:hypothetical protein BGX30_015232 [Mortierella sp. GBA39]|nr:hypothetical protein BGX30_015232 [Mortierella sp. GBA39]
MGTYLTKRIIYMIVILFAASFLIFSLYALTPVDFISSNIKLSPERKAELREIYGLSKPLLERYGIWMNNVFHGDFGFSLAQQQPVLKLFNQYIWNSFLLAVVSTFLTWVIAQDYIRTARAKGLKEDKVLFRHALRNALLPAITLVGFELPALFGGSIIIEKIFNWPGIGQLYMQSFSLRDYPLLMGFTMLLAILTVIGTLLSDVLYHIADPRVRLH